MSIKITTSTRIHGAQRIFAATLNGFLGGLLGMAGAAGSQREAMANRITGLVIVLAAWLLRAKVIPLDVLAGHLAIVATLLAGSLGGAWCAVEKARTHSWLFLDRVILAILPAFAWVMLAQTMLGHDTARLLAAAAPRAAAGVLAGFCSGFATTALGMAGSLLLAPAIVVLYGIDSQIAGSLALMIALPTMLVGLRQFSGADLLVFIREERRLCLTRSCMALPGIVLGVLLLRSVTPQCTLVSMSIVLAYAAWAQWRALHAAWYRCVK